MIVDEFGEMLGPRRIRYSEDARRVRSVLNALADDLKAQVVPEPEALQLGNDAVEFERATIPYADAF